MGSLFWEILNFLKNISKIVSKGYKNDAMSINLSTSNKNHFAILRIVRYKQSNFFPGDYPISAKCCVSNKNQSLDFTVQEISGQKLPTVLIFLAIS